jgi:hypothetical protein
MYIQFYAACFGPVWRADYLQDIARLQFVISMLQMWALYV